MSFDAIPSLFWFLLPVAAASGWYVGRGSRFRRESEERAPRLAPDYFKGLNYLLNEQPDKAIEVFIKLLEVESETVETHLALGNLFRRRGEVDRAIRIHQNLIARPTLSKQQRYLALLELGMDYMRSGLLDRAEALFQELLEVNLHTVPALRHLVEIYQQEQDWNAAIAYARKLEGATGESMSNVIAHYYCEQAEQARREGNPRQASELIKRALAVDRRCVRASLLEGEMALEAGRPKAAIRSFQRVAQQDPSYLPEAIPPLRRCYRELDDMDGFSAYLRRLVDEHNAITPVLVLTEMIAQSQGVDEAILYLGGELRKRPSVRGLQRLVEYAIGQAQGMVRDNLLIVQDFISKLLENRPIYRCSHCGFTGKTLHWQCPGCKYWNTVKPIHGIEGE